MQPSVNVNDWTDNLPRVTTRRVWDIMIDGKLMGTVSANSCMAAFDAARAKYPNGSLELIRSKVN